MGLLQASRCDPGRRGVSFPQGQRLSAGQEGLTAFALLAVGAGVGMDAAVGVSHCDVCRHRRDNLARTQGVQDLTRPGPNASMLAFWSCYNLPDFTAAVGALIDEVDLCHAPMGLDVSDEHRQKSEAARAENHSVLSCVVLDISWHVGSPSPRSAAITAPSQLTAHDECPS